MSKKGILMQPCELGEDCVAKIKGSDVDLVVLTPDKGQSPTLALEWLFRDVKFGKYHRALRELRENGIDVEYEAHAASHLLPRAFFGIHPHWFRMNEKGERTSDFNFCPSSLEALDYVAWRAAALGAVLHPSTHRYHFLPDHAEKAFCHCPACKHLSPADQLMTISNAILRGLRERDPKAEQCYYAPGADFLTPCRTAAGEGIFLECDLSAAEDDLQKLFSVFEKENAYMFCDAKLPEGRNELCEKVACVTVPADRVVSVSISSKRDRDKLQF